MCVRRAACEGKQLLAASLREAGAVGVGLLPQPRPEHGPLHHVPGPQISSPEQEIVLLGPAMPRREKGRGTDLEKTWNQRPELALLPEERNSRGRSIFGF